MVAAAQPPSASRCAPRAFKISPYLPTHIYLPTSLFKATLSLSTTNVEHNVEIAGDYLEILSCAYALAPPRAIRGHTHTRCRGHSRSAEVRERRILVIQITDYSPLLITPGAGPRVLPVRTPLTGSPVRTPAATTLPRRECAPRDLLLLPRSSPRDGETHRETGALADSGPRGERSAGRLSFSLRFFSHMECEVLVCCPVPQAVPPPSLSGRGARGGRAGWLWAQV